MSLDKTGGSRAMPETSLLRYLKRIFKLKQIDGCSDAAAAIDCIENEAPYVPEGFSSEMTVIFERTNVRGTIWTLTPRNTLGNIALEIGEGNYFLISDDTLQGDESLFLCTVSVCACDEDRSNDLSYIVGKWAGHGCPNILMGGYVDKETNNTVTLVAAQLKTIV